MQIRAIKQLKQGFSLAEVLIVLALLGIIATFTIPKIVGGNVQDTQFKKIGNQNNVQSLLKI